MKAAWINLGGIMALVDESGRLTGELMPMDKQIHQKITKSLYEAPRAFEVDGYKILNKPPDSNKSA